MDPDSRFGVSVEMAAAGAAAAYNYDASGVSQDFAEEGSVAYANQMAAAAAVVGNGWKAEVIYQDETNVVIGFTNPVGDPGLISIRGTDDFGTDLAEYSYIQKGEVGTYAREAETAVKERLIKGFGFA